VTIYKKALHQLQGKSNNGNWLPSQKGTGPLALRPCLSASLLIIQLSILYFERERKSSSTN